MKKNSTIGSGSLVFACLTEKKLMQLYSSCTDKHPIIPYHVLSCFFFLYMNLLSRTSLAKVFLSKGWRGNIFYMSTNEIDVNAVNRKNAEVPSFDLPVDDSAAKPKVRIHSKPGESVCESCEG